jgi:hypothetical protein
MYRFTKARVRGSVLAFARRIPENQPSKPPIGIMPQWLFEEKRLLELSQAINRFCEANAIYEKNHHLLLRWLGEFRERLDRVQQLKQIKQKGI